MTHAHLAPWSCLGFPRHDHGISMVLPRYFHCFPRQLRLSARGPVVSVVSFVMHHKLVVHEVEAVGARLEGVLDHQLDGGRVELGELVDVLAGVLAVGDAETEVEVEGLEMAVSEIAALIMLILMMIAVMKMMNLKKCLSIILKFLTGLAPTLNSTVAPTVCSFRNWNIVR